MLTYEQLESRLAQWAQTQPAIRAVIACGSRARGDADRWSDLDVMIFTTDRARCAADPSWLRTFGDVWLTFTEPTAPGDPEWYAVYAGGLKLDATLLDVKDAALDLESLLAFYPYQGVFGRGLNVLYDRAGVPRRIPPRQFAPPAPPTAEAFDVVVSEFLLEALTSAKFIRRGDFWRAQRWLTEFLRRCLLRMIEWHAYGRDTWYSGRFIEDWADPRVRAALPATFALYERASLSAALSAMLALMRLTGEDVAARFGFVYPAQAHEQIRNLVEQIVVETGA